MFTDFGSPPNAASTRSLVDQRVEEQHKNAGVAETLTVEWRGRPLHVEVIDMPLEVLYYNPGTHRIRAQRSLDSDRDAALSADPWSSEGQDYLRHLLTVRPAQPDHRDPDFDALIDSLKQHKQIEPGLITRDGILVNGNTRCAALRDPDADIGVTSMRVGVLPESCTWDDINDVEISLQLRPDKRRDYSYINRLLAIDEQRVQLNRELSAIAKAFHSTVKACERDIWVFAQLQDLIKRSATPGGASLRLMDFEGAQERLAELYRIYEKEHSKSKEKADLLKEARLAAIVLEFSKTDVRTIGGDFHSRYLDRTLPEEFKAAGTTTPSTVQIPGLNRSVKAAGAEVAAARAFTDVVLRAKTIESVGTAASSTEHTAALKTIKSVRDAFDEAIDSAGRDARLRKKQLAAPDRIIEACKDLEQSITDLVLSRGSASLDEGAFDDALVQLRTVLDNLAIEAQRTIDLPGEGLSWLIAALDVKRPQS
ncbi:transcriptional regulator [Nocardia brasiliensis]|uniref:transcriptional regulator n=1 Tax=Nocardia brasiliensis TaxID=37326 RepID=UPI0024576545|nr:transcriptional regulator [Nocardia brasiliensis]